MNVNIVLQIIANKEINKLKISKTRNSLFKILILEINDKEFLFSWSFKRNNSYVRFTRPIFLLNY